MKFEELPPGAFHIEVRPIYCLYNKSSAHTRLFTSPLPKRREEEQNYACVYVFISVQIHKTYSVLFLSLNYLNEDIV